MRRFVAVLLSVFAVAATGVVGFALAGPTQHSATTVTNVTVHAGEYYFTLDVNSAPAGQVHFHVVNDGQVEHDFSIAGQKTAIISPGGSADLTINFSQPGNYGYICTVGEHAVYGMTGNFTVTGQATTTVITTGGTTVTQTTTTPTPPKPPIKATVNVALKEFKIAITKRAKVRVKKGKRFVFVYKNVAVHSLKASNGRVKFLVRNIGKLAHNFVINQQQTPVLSPKKSSTLVVTFTNAGNYHFECSITGHAAAGMKGNLKITG
jgi:uncharacterized cupredoxin-like copper-binding protein